MWRIGHGPLSHGSKSNWTIQTTQYKEKWWIEKINPHYSLVVALCDCAKGPVITITTTPRLSPRLTRAPSSVVDVHLSILSQSLQKVWTLSLFCFLLCSLFVAAWFCLVHHLVPLVWTERDILLLFTTIRKQTNKQTTWTIKKNKTRMQSKCH